MQTIELHKIGDKTLVVYNCIVPSTIPRHIIVECAKKSSADLRDNVLSKLFESESEYKVFTSIIQK